MAKKESLTVKSCDEAEGPSDGKAYVILYDHDTKGFGLRVTRAGAKSFILNYRNASGIELRFGDLDTFHRKITTKQGTPYRANRALALLSKMLSLAVRWEMRTDNPAKGVERNHEERRYRYLSPEELERLIAALVAHPNRTASNIIRLLLLTGARAGEVLGATWDQLDLE